MAQTSFFNFLGFFKSSSGSKEVVQRSGDEEELIHWTGPRVWRLKMLVPE